MTFIREGKRACEQSRQANCKITYPWVLKTVNSELVPETRSRWSVTLTKNVSPTVAHFGSTTKSFVPELAFVPFFKNHSILATKQNNYWLSVIYLINKLTVVVNTTPSPFLIILIVTGSVWKQNFINTRFQTFPKLTKVSMCIIPLEPQSIHHQLTFWIDLIARRPGPGAGTCKTAFFARLSSKLKVGLQIAKAVNITTRIANSRRTLKEAISKFYNLIFRSKGWNLTS